MSPLGRIWPPPIVRESTRGRSRRVLVVEDDPEFRELVCQLLGGAGYDVCAARDGAELLEQVAEAATRDGVGLDPFCAIVTDVRMPGLSGTDAMELLRQGPWRHIPVVVMTAFAESLTTARANQLGAAAVLEKPFDSDRLRQTMARVAPHS